MDKQELEQTAQQLAAVIESLEKAGDIAFKLSEDIGQWEAKADMLLRKMRAEQARDNG